MAFGNRIERTRHHIALADKSAFSDARLKDQIQGYWIKSARCGQCVITTATQGKPRFRLPGFRSARSAAVFPERVSRGDDGYLMLFMRSFEAVAVLGMQELSGENAVLKADSAALKADAVALKAQLVQQSAEFQARLNAVEAKLQ